MLSQHQKPLLYSILSNLIDFEHQSLIAWVYLGTSNYNSNRYKRGEKFPDLLGLLIEAYDSPDGEALSLEHIQWIIQDITVAGKRKEGG